MAYEQKPGDLVVFKNNDKKADNQPDYKGRGLDLDGQEIGIALWVKEGKTQKFLSGRIERKQAQQQQSATQQQRQQAPPPANNDLLPF